MATVWLTYNGKGLTSHADYGLGYGSSPTPTPTPTPLASGNVRFKFDDTSKTVQDLYDVIFDDNHCTVVQVLDANTGLPIPGLFDVEPADVYSGFQYVYKGALSLENCGGRVDLVDSYVNARNADYFWQLAFANSTAIRNITMTHSESTSRQTFVNMVDKSSVENIDIDYGGSALGTSTLGDSTPVTVTLRNFTGAIPNNLLNRVATTTLNLYPYASQHDTAVFGNLTNGYTWASYINIYTYQPSNTSYAFSKGTTSNLFEGKGLVELHAFGYTGASDPRPEIDLLLPSDCTSMFADCQIKHLSRFRFDCTNLTNADKMFYVNTLCEDGIVDTYNVLSAKLTGSYGHNQTFYHCGSGTTSGAAELAQLPSNWK